MHKLRDLSDLLLGTGWGLPLWQSTVSHSTYSSIPFQHAYYQLLWGAKRKLPEAKLNTHWSPLFLQAPCCRKIVIPFLPPLALRIVCVGQYRGERE
jgi:hypothetical protein